MVGIAGLMLGILVTFHHCGALEGGVSVEMVCCYQISAEVGLGLILGIGHICHIRHTSFWTFLHCVCRDGMLLSVLV